MLRHPDADREPAAQPPARFPVHDELFDRTDRLHRLATEITATGGTAATRRLDVTEAADVQDFVAAAQERYGRVDVMVDNAGVMPLSPLEALRTEEWNRMIDVNMRGVLHGISAA